MQKQEQEKQFENTIRQNELLIWKVCRIYAYTNADRKDLFQEIVIQLWNAYPHFKGNAAITTWLYRVAINTAITRLRKEKHFITSYEPAALPTTVSDETTHQIAEEQLQQLYAAIELLNQVERAIVLLYMEDTPYAEMEEILGINQGHIRVKMNRIKKKLRELTNNNC
ncbi:MAG: sigma-70 family RNA polymerase sigma factor [Sphingobacteriaceae bacterium]|nr:MAG: sigma-70 family RNA polymerase sigma factor [Sphingobacteriaceae bacterium]